MPALLPMGNPAECALHAFLRLRDWIGCAHAAKTAEAGRFGAPGFWLCSFWCWLGLLGGTGKGQGMYFLLADGVPGWRKAALGGAVLIALAGCQDVTGGLFKARTDAGPVSQNAPSAALSQQDLEAPSVFQVADQGLWDGRPSLGGVWVAHPDVKEPERVIIRNTANSKFVIGALFRRERANPGPEFQVSSEAAAALGMLAGAPAGLNVTALRREETPESGAAAEDAATSGAQSLSSGTAEASTSGPVAGAAEISTLEAPAPQTVRASTPATSGLSRPYIQIGIFSVEQNAENTAGAMRQAGMQASVREEGSQGKTFWRVAVGPAATEAERAALMIKIKNAGFDDAYPVSN